MFPVSCYQKLCCYDECNRVSTRMSVSLEQCPKRGIARWHISTSVIMRSSRWPSAPSNTCEGLFLTLLPAQYHQHSLIIDNPIGKKRSDSTFHAFSAFASVISSASHALLPLTWSLLGPRPFSLRGHLQFLRADGILPQHVVLSLLLHLPYYLFRHLSPWWLLSPREGSWLTHPGVLSTQH